jgi:hypothetical protein
MIHLYNQSDSVIPNKMKIKNVLTSALCVLSCYMPIQAKDPLVRTITIDTKNPLDDAEANAKWDTL